MSDLKPCPSGHAAEIGVSPPLRLGGGELSLWLAHGRCPTCHWTGPHCHGETEAYVRVEATRLWNTRAPAVPVEALVDAFLRWPLPDTFSPDGGITFDPSDGPLDPRDHSVEWPTGTNLLTATEAKAMFEWLIDQARGGSE